MAHDLRATHPPACARAERFEAAGQGTNRRLPLERSQRARRHAGEVPEQGPAVEEVRPQTLGHGEYHLAVRHGRQQGLLQPETPPRQALGVAAGTAR